MRRSRLTTAILELGRKLRVAQEARPGGALGAPPSAFEQVTRERADALSKRLDAIELKINALLVAMCGAFLAELWRAIGH